MTKDQEQSFITHLAELRSTILKSLLLFVILVLVSFYFASDLYTFITNPLRKILPDSSFFIATHPFETWMAYLKISLAAGLFASLPLILGMIWKFVSPGLYKTEKIKSFILIFVMCVLFYTGAYFGYQVLLPYIFDFLVEIIKPTDITFLPQVKDVLSFSLKMLIAFGILFELPIVMTLATAFGLLSARQFFNWQGYVFVICFVVSAFLTPPDVVSQIILGIPLFVLYEMGLLSSAIVDKLKKS